MLNNKLTKDEYLLMYNSNITLYQGGIIPHVMAQRTLSSFSPSKCEPDAIQGKTSCGHTLYDGSYFNSVLVHVNLRCLLLASLYPQAQHKVSASNELQIAIYTTIYIHINYKLS